MKQMPQEPTDEMIDALTNFRDYGGRAYEVYQDIYESAPEVEQDQSKRIAELEAKLAKCVKVIDYCVRCESMSPRANEVLEALLAKVKAKDVKPLIPPPKPPKFPENRLINEDKDF